MLKCRDVAEHADKYVDKDLSWFQRLSWKLHFIWCPPCKYFVDQFSTTIKVASRIGREKQVASDEDVKKINDAIDQAQKTPD